MQYQIFLYTRKRGVSRHRNALRDDTSAGTLCRYSVPTGNRSSLGANQNKGLRAMLPAEALSSRGHH